MFVALFVIDILFVMLRLARYKLTKTMVVHLAAVVDVFDSV